MNIPIVVVSYNRADCLKRLLQSLKKASYEVPVKLIISIDGGGTEDVKLLADSFNWQYGTKEVIKHENNLGLRKHILHCGRLAKQYDGVILLEDDLYVAPYFYSYTLKAQQFYKKNELIAGVALYSHQYNETACLPFIAIEDGHDIFFMQLACSWGQCWLSHQWEKFEEWYEINKDRDLSKDESISPDVRLWPATSWKKYFIKYLIEKDKYFVYPRTSYTTNFGDAGEHHNGTNIFQVPLQYGDNKLDFPDFHKSIAKYDSYCEILPESIKSLNSELKEYGFDVNIYGLKKNSFSNNQYVLSRRECKNYIQSYSFSLKPQEMNIIEGCQGRDIFLAKKEDICDYSNFLEHRVLLISDNNKVHPYYYAITPMHYYRFNVQIQAQTEQIQTQTEQIHEIRNCYSYRIGNLVIKPLSIFKSVINKFKKGKLYCDE